MPHLKVRQPILLDTRHDDIVSNTVLSKSISQSIEPVDETKDAPKFSEVVHRLSNDQLRQLLALDDNQVAQVRANPEFVYGINTGVSERADAVRVGVHQNKIVPDHDNKIGSFVGSLVHIAGLPVEGVLKALDLYERNISTPFAATAIYAAQQLIPGDTDFEERVAANQRAGLGYFAARVKAFDETTDWSPLVKTGLKMGLDPLIFAGVARGGVRVATSLIKPIQTTRELAIAGGAGTKLGLLSSMDDAIKSIDPSDATILGKSIFPDFLKSKIDPSSTAKGIAEGSPEQAIIGYRKLQAQGMAYTELALSHVRALGPTDKFFKIKDGYVKNLEGVEPAWGDLFQNPSAYKLTSEQTNYITQLHGMFDEGFAMMKREGLLMDEDKIEFVNDMMHYVPRVNITEGRKVLRLRSVKPVGSDPFFMKSRSFQTMQEGMYAGETYADPVQTASVYLHSLYERIAAERFKVAIEPLISEAGGSGKILVTHPLFREGAFVDVDVAKSVARLLDDRGVVGLVKAAAGASGAMRTAQATTDMSTPFIQGLPLLFTNPGVWGVAAKKSYEAFFDPVVRSRYIRDNADHIADMVGHDMILGSSEFTEALRQGGWLAKLPNSQVFQQTIGRFQSSFETFLDIGRIETTKALYQTALRSGPKGLNELSGFANKLLGAVDTGAMGVPLSQRQFESAMLFFAPRYTRAIAALMLDMTRGGLRGNEARWAFGRLAAGMTATHMAAAYALGQEPNLDPSKAHFLQVQLNGQWIGMGGKARSFLKAGTNIVKASYENPMGLLHVNIFTDQEARDNPIIQWLRSGAAPASSTALTILSGEDPVGRALSFDEPVDYLKFVNSHLFPFAVASAWDRGQFDTTAFSSEFIGLIASDVTASNQRQQMRDKWAKSQFGQEWNQIALDQQAQIRDAHPELKEVERLAEVEQAKYRSAQSRVQAFSALDSAKARQVSSLNLAGRAFDQGIDGQNRGFQFRKRVGDAATKYGEARVVIESTYRNVFDEIQRLKGRGGQNVVNVAFNDYAARVFGPETTNPVTGDHDYVRADKVKQELRAQYGNEVIDRVETELQRRKRNPEQGDLPKSVLEYYDAVEGLRAYWDVWKTALSGKELAAYKLYQESPPQTQKQLLRASQVIRTANVRVKVAQLNMKRNNAQMDWWLHLYYDQTPRNQDNIRKLNQG